METTIQVQQRDGVDHIHYIGPINEEAEVHLSRLLQTIGPKCVINFRQVAYVNSCGVRAWINFMRELEKNRMVVFEECTSEIVMQINMIPSFRGKAKVKSVYGSYACGECDAKKSVLFEAGKNLPSSEGAEVAPVKCDSCSSEMELEEIEDEFFAFSMTG